MSLNANATRLTFNVLPFLRAARLSSAQRSPCASCFSSFEQRRERRSLSRRTLATAAAYRPENLDPAPPPRNVGTPDTSISSGDADLSSSRDLSQKVTHTLPPMDTSEREGVAQESRPPLPEIVATDAIAEASPTPTKPERKSKLRPRKAAMKLSDKAITQLRDLLEQPDPKLIRVGVKNRGCSGLAYHLEYVDKAGMFDEAVEQEGVKVLIDSKALFSIIGSEMDWVEDKLSARFVFRNPNITEQCGCGESFSVS